MAAARAIIIAILFACVSLVLGQYNFINVRDPRSNTGKGQVLNPGPVVFPMSPLGPETSGVRVGASGYGFVPPGSRGGIGPHGAGPNAGALPYYPGLTFF